MAWWLLILSDASILLYLKFSADGQLYKYVRNRTHYLEKTISRRNGVVNMTLQNFGCF